MKPRRVPPAEEPLRRPLAMARRGCETLDALVDATYGWSAAVSDDHAQIEEIYDDPDLRTTHDLVARDAGAEFP